MERRQSVARRLDAGPSFSQHLGGGGVAAAAAGAVAATPMGGFAAGDQTLDQAPSFDFGIVGSPPKRARTCSEGAGGRSGALLQQQPHQAMAQTTPGWSLAAAPSAAPDATLDPATMAAAATAAAAAAAALVTPCHWPLAAAPGGAAAGGGPAGLDLEAAAAAAAMGWFPFSASVATGNHLLQTDSVGRTMLALAMEHSLALASAGGGQVAAHQSQQQQQQHATLTAGKALGPGAAAEQRGGTPRGQLTSKNVRLTLQALLEDNG